MASEKLDLNELSSLNKTPEEVFESIMNDLRGSIEEKLPDIESVKAEISKDLPDSQLKRDWEGK